MTIKAGLKVSSKIRPEHPIKWLIAHMKNFICGIQIPMGNINILSYTNNLDPKKRNNKIDA